MICYNNLPILSVMRFETYEITAILPEVTDVFSVHVRQKRKTKHSLFKPGQYYHIRIPTYQDPQSTRPFSAIKSSLCEDWLEFCIKSYGPFTRHLLEKKPGDKISLFGPLGKFILTDTIEQAIFLAGGVGITPIYAIIQSLSKSNNKFPVTLLYANTVLSSILKKEQIDSLFKTFDNGKLIYILSREKIINTPYNMLSGHIDRPLIDKVITASPLNHYFLSGSHKFTTAMYQILTDYGIDYKLIKQEIFSV